MKYKVKVTEYRPADLAESDVMPVSEAAKTLGMTMPGVIRAIERGALTEVIDDDATYHARRLVLRKEVERLYQSRNGIKSPIAGKSLASDSGYRWELIGNTATNLKTNPTNAALQRTLEMIRACPQKKEPIYLYDFIEECLREFERPIRGKGLRIQTNVPRDLPPVEGDRALLKQAFTELIENAIKYNKPEGYLRIQLQQDKRNKNFFISFVNAGDVIPAEEINEVFRPFFRSNRVKGTVPGQGIGLSLVKEVLKVLGGDIEFKPQQEKEEVEFRVMLPVTS